jgi:hypothetical protein
MQSFGGFSIQTSDHKVKKNSSWRYALLFIFRQKLLTANSTSIQVSVDTILQCRTAAMLGLFINYKTYDCYVANNIICIQICMDIGPVVKPLLVGRIHP